MDCISKMNAWRGGLRAVPFIWEETELVPRRRRRLFWGLLSITCICVSGALAQDSPSPPPALSPSPTATVAPTRSVRITFLPPPLEGTISLGIYNEWDQLVRVLHQEAGLDEFVIGEDALSTKWDGKDDDGENLPPGKYQAHGFAIGNLKIETTSASPAAPPDMNLARSIPVKLMANPLANDERAVVELSVGFDDENSFLKTADGLPVCTLAKKPNIRRATLAKAGDKSIDIWVDDGAQIEQLRVSNVDKMMAFDCGDFELK
jgi:hypothetical protein